MQFSKFKDAVARQFKAMSAADLFRTTVEKDAMWEHYLSSFPEGTNNIYRKRREYDCSCCRQFMRAVGNVVAVMDNKLVSIWDITVDEPAFQVVADAMSALVKSHPIDNVFLHTERVAGNEKTFEEAVGGVITYEHFFVNIPQKFVCSGKDIGSKLSDSRAMHDVLLRSLNEISFDAVDTVLELIAQNSLYRGEEHQRAVAAFKTYKLDFAGLLDSSRDLFAWTRSIGAGGAVAKIRNTSIGTLLIDLSEGMELEGAVRKFEAMVAPANYKRPTALVTKAMVEKAKATLQELGLTSALERRYAALNDITVNNIIYANRDAKKVILNDVFDDIVGSIPNKPKNLDKVEEVSIDKFLADILPKADSIEALVENRLSGNLVSLIAPADPTAGQLFKWDNLFSWSYNGDLADSDIRRAVQARGGRVDGVFRFSHSWNYDKRNASLMDLHVFLPDNRITAENVINDTYGNSERVGWNHRNHPKSGGVQDVDYTHPAPVGYIPVENITFPSLHRMPEGTYICKIHNWQLRTPTQGGFRAEIEFGGEVFQYEVDRPLKNKEWVTVAEVTLKDGQFTIKHHLSTGTTSKKVWGIDTETFQKVNVIMHSPNHWDGQGVGNRHYFFMLDGCQNDGQARGFYNEFLKSELDPHRKVFEMVGSKMRADESKNQLSGLGFSSTQRNHVMVRVKGSFSRVLKVVF
jgi:hypothetical protein